MPDGAMYPMYKFKDEIRDYFEEFHDRIIVDGTSRRKVYKGLLKSKFSQGEKKGEPDFGLTEMKEQLSYLDELPTRTVQLSMPMKRPPKCWDGVTTTLEGLGHQEHYVLVLPSKTSSSTSTSTRQRQVSGRGSRRWVPSYAELSRDRGWNPHHSSIFRGSSAFTAGAAWSRARSTQANPPPSTPHRVHRPPGPYHS